MDLAAGESSSPNGRPKAQPLSGSAIDNSLAALFAVRDTLKPDAADVVALLQQQGLKVHLLTGDNALTAASIAKQVGIAPENVFAEVRPDQKAEFVKQLQAQGERVAFVGDGINDAPALTQADLGIAVSRASDVAREAADIILLKSEIAAVPEALGPGAGDLADDQAELVLGVLLQRGRRAAGGVGVHESGALRGGDGRLRLDRDWQCAAAEPAEICLCAKPPAPANVPPVCPMV